MIEHELLPRGPRKVHEPIYIYCIYIHSTTWALQGFFRKWDLQDSTLLMFFFECLVETSILKVEPVGQDKRNDSIEQQGPTSDHGDD